jgi:hypothetical protein
MFEAVSRADGEVEKQDPRHPAVIAGHQRLDRMHDEIVRLGLGRNVLDSRSTATRCSTM